jgi:hypothetical protein
MNDVARVKQAFVVLAVMTAAAAGACGPSEPRTDAERLARGREIVDRMSAKLGAAQAFSVTTHEIRNEVKGSGEAIQVDLTRQAVIRRPDRFYTKVVGGRENEIWYDGVGVTIALHKEKVFGQARVPETLDKTLDALHERYGIATPFGDFMYNSPAKALIADSTTGGWVGRETVAGQEADHLAFKDKGVNWELWIPTKGDPLPLKSVTEFTDNRRLRKVELTFSDWNLAPQIAADRFTPSVPADYEGIAILQRARVLKHVPQDDAAEGVPTAGTAKK